MMPIRFDKGRAEKVLESINTGAPFEVPPEGWNLYNLLHVAGGCFFAIMSQSPTISRDAAGSPALRRDLDEAGLPHEHREARDETLREDTLAAVEWYAQATMWVQDGEYDERFEPVHEALMSDTRDVKPVRGFRKV